VNTFVNTQTRAMTNKPRSQAVTHAVVFLRRDTSYNYTAAQLVGFSDSWQPRMFSYVFFCFFLFRDIFDSTPFTLHRHWNFL